MKVARVIQATLAVACVGALATARRFGGAADPATSIPEPIPVDAAPARSATTEGEEVVLRLVDAVGDARVTAPALDRGAMLLAAHWRKMPLAFHAVPASARALTTSIALRTSEAEVAWAVPLASGGHWAPDARVWNMSEGSFDQREAIFAPTPAAIAFHTTLPLRARLVFAPGTANATGDATVFSVSVTDAHGTPTPVFERRMLPEETSGWAGEVSVDLAVFGGQTVDIELATRAESRTDDERRRGRRRPTTPDTNDAGAPAEARPASGLTLALWGNPEIRAQRATEVPFNVLFIVVDALRPDVLASFHHDDEDEAKLAAPLKPLDALLPKVPGLTPNIDALATRGVRFTHAYSAGAWTRPGTLAMLSGMRSTELGVDPLTWVLPEAAANAYYQSNPPLLPLLLRRAGVATRAFVNNYFMVGYAPVGLDMGFERVSDHRYRTKDTGEITRDTIDWLKHNAATRFFAFCNYNSPHEPLEPPARFLERLPPEVPRDPSVRAYMAEAAKDDEAVGVLLQTLDELHLRERTLVVLTADHGETLSAEHTGTSDLDHMPVRFHHAVTDYEETTRIPILLSLPGVLPEGLDVRARVRNVDIGPTLLELLGRERVAQSGASMMPLVQGKAEDERTVLSEGRGQRGLMFGHWRALFREGKAQTTCIQERCTTVSEELFDLDADPGERRNVARAHPDVLEEMRARLAAAKKNTPVAGTPAATATTETKGAQRLQIRFAGAGGVHHVSGKVVFPPDTVLTWETSGASPTSLRQTASTLELALTTSATDVVGLDVTPTPANADVRWDLFLDDDPWPVESVFVGPFGLFDARVTSGLLSAETRELALASALPTIDPARDLGMFVVREGEREAVTHANARASSEVDALLKDWGYAHKTAPP